MALEKIDGISGAYVNDGITLHFTAKDSYDQAKITEALKPFKLTIKKSTLVKDSPFAKEPAITSPK